MRFLLDENVPRDAALALRNEGHDVVWVPHSDLRGSDDEALWALAVREERIFVTADLGFPHPKPTPIAVMLLRGFDRVSTATEAGFLADAVRELGDEIAGKLLVLTPGRMRVRRLE
ncbi:MAG: DUF5615 family PIN-like protein [Dehalococcoidia bacterium]